MSRERIEEIFSKLRIKVESYKDYVRFPNDHPETYKYREYFIEAERVYESLSDNDKRELEGKMDYIRMYSPQSHTRR